MARARPTLSVLLSLLAGISFGAWSADPAPARSRAVPPTVKAVPPADKRPGYGVVETVTEVRVVTGDPSSSAGGSKPGALAGRPAYRIGVRMADGSLQYRDLHKPEFAVGDAVLLTNAGDVVPD